jgi:A/G-specific adenine glycosylase
MASRTGSRASVQRLATPSTGDRRRFRRALLRWYDRNGRDLPWRRTDDPYHILVSEIMLQQTQVDRVLPKYREWLDKYPSFHALAGADEEDAVKTWYPLGYNIRPRRLHAIAREAVGRFGGELPEDEETLRSFKGIGPYTAGALMSFAFRKRAPILDTNVARVLFRVVIGRGNPKAHQMRKHLWRLSELMMPQKRVFDYNQALMDFGALVCPARNPKCPECPMAGFCRAYGLGARDSGLGTRGSAVSGPAIAAPPAGRPRRGKRESGNTSKTTRR